MATEVAAVLARYIVRAEGYQEVAAASDNLRQRFAGVQSQAQGLAQEMEALNAAQQALVATANSTSAEVAKQRAVLQELIGSYKEGSAAIDQQIASLGEMGTSVATLGADLAALQGEWQSVQAAMQANQAASRALRERIDELYDARRKLNIRTQGEEFAQLTDEVKKAEQALGELADKYGELKQESEGIEFATANLQAAQTLLGAEGATRTEALAGISQAADRLKRMGAAQDQVAGSSKRMANGLRFTNGELGRLLTGVATGRAGLYSFNEFFGRMILGMKSAIPTIAAVAAPIVLLVSGFKIASSATVQFGQALAGARPEIQGVYDQLQDLTNFGNQELLAFLEQATNRLQSFGAVDASGTARTIAELANIGQFRLPGPGDAGQVAQMIQRAVEGVNFDPLRDLGLPVDELNAKLQKLAADGMTKAAQRAEILNEVGRQLNQDVLGGEAQARANAEFRTMAGVMAEIKNIFASIGQDENLVAAANEFVVALRAALPLLAGIAQLAATVGTILVRGATEFARLLTDPAGALKDVANRALTQDRATSQNNPLNDNFIRRIFRGEGSDVLKESIEQTTEETDLFADALKTVDGIVSRFDGTADQAANSLTRMQRAMEQAQGRQGAFGLIDGVKQLSQAFLNLDKDASPANAVDALRAYDQVLAQVIEKGPQQLELLRLQAERLFSTGLIDQSEFDALQEGFNAIEGVVKPIEDEAARIRGRIDDSTNATNNFNGAMQTVEGSAAAVNGQLGAMTGNINSAIGAAYNLAGALGSITLQNPLGLVGFGSGGQGGASFSAPGSVRRQGADFARQGAGGRGLSSADQALLNSARGSAQDKSGQDLRDAINNVGKVFDIGATGGGGGGGGGGGAGASIEEIRQLFRNIGELIKIGTNNGVFFSTAGNTIPLGGKNEFLNTKGGSLIQTVNIRGIWDFADPAAKRQIMKELEEALAQLKKETK